MYIYVAVNFLFQLIFVFPLFLGMVMHANEFETKEKQKLTEIKNKLQHIYKYIKLLIRVVTYCIILKMAVNTKDLYGNSGKRF